MESGTGAEPEPSYQFNHEHEFQQDPGQWREARPEKGRNEYEGRRQRCRAWREAGDQEGLQRDQNRPHEGLAQDQEHHHRRGKWG